MARVPAPFQPIVDYLLDPGNPLESECYTRYMEKLYENIRSQLEPLSRLKRDGSITPITIPTKAELLKPYERNEHVHSVLTQAFDTKAGQFLLGAEYLFSNVQQTFCLEIPTDSFREAMKNTVRMSVAADVFGKFVDEALHGVYKRYTFYRIKLPNRFVYSAVRHYRDDWLCQVLAHFYGGQGDEQEPGHMIGHLGTPLERNRYPLLGSLHHKFGLQPHTVHELSFDRSLRCEHGFLSHNLNLPHVNTAREGRGQKYTSYLGDVINTNVQIGNLYEDLYTTYEREDNFINHF